MNIVAKSNELKEIINDASSVFLMAHKDLDLDAINSCLGIDFYLKTLKKKSFIIIDDKRSEPGVKKVLKKLDRKVKIIKSHKVITKKDDKSLLIILDTNKQKLTQNPEILNEFTKIVNIDHHDTTSESILATLSIIDSNISSTCEMIAQFLKTNNININEHIATLLLGGIILDTNYFKSHVNAETFYTSYYLVSNGGQVSEVNELLKQDIKDYIKRQKIISSVKVINHIAIGKGLQRSEYKKEELAKTADSLLTFNNIKASFAVARIDKELVGVSGRSTGAINVGKVLEKFGGGGSETEAAAKIEKTNVNKVISELSNIIKSL